MAFAAYADAPPVIEVEAPQRVAYLRKVAGLTVAGLAVSGVAALLSAAVIAVVPTLMSPGISLVIIFGSYGIANYVARSVVFSSSSAAGRYGGFFMASIFQGIAMGYLFLTAILMAMQEYGNPFAILFQAMGLVGLTAFGMLMYLMTGPRNLSMLGGALSMMFLPMLALMGLGAASFYSPTLGAMFGGTLGLAISALFVVVSAGGLLYQLNQVLHRLSVHMHVEGAYMVTMGLLILFWNVLVLILRLQRR